MLLKRGIEINRAKNMIILLAQMGYVGGSFC